MLFMLVVPLSTHAQSNSYVLIVECYSDSPPSAAVGAVVFLGHGVSTACHGDMENGNVIEFASSQSGTFKVFAFAGGVVQAPQGTFSIYDCYADGVVYGPGTWVYWEIIATYCDI